MIKLFFPLSFSLMLLSAEAIAQDTATNKKIDPVFTKVEQEAKFPGGVDGWRQFLERNLNANVAANDGARPGNYTVKLQFIVDKEGNISNVQAVDVPKACPSCGPEGVKVIRKSPKWIPAMQNGKQVTYQAVQFITFQVARR
jgi:periplasmic protein TonB